MICPVNEFEGKKKQLTRDLSMAYYKLVYFHNRHQVYHQVDSLYARVSQAAENSHDKGALSYLEMLNAQLILSGGSPAADPDAARY